MSITDRAIALIHLAQTELEITCVSHGRVLQNIVLKDYARARQAERELERAKLEITRRAKQTADTVRIQLAPTTAE